MADKNILNPEEVMIIQMALTTMIEDLEATSKNTKIPFTPDARRDLNSMLRNAESAKEKIGKISGHVVQLDAYQEGDENGFLTKES